MMAQSKKRDREHVENEQVNNNTHKEMEEDNVEQNETEDINSENNENIPAKKPKLLSAKEFRQAIRTDDKNLAIKTFHSLLSSSETSETLIHDYLKCGGNCLEILQLLEAETNIPQVLILESTQLILLRIIANYPQCHTNAFEACRYLLNTHINLVNKMLGLTSSGKERRIMLKLLTAIVTFSASLAKDILVHVKFHAANLEVLTKNTGNDVNSVRNAFIHFLIAFLVDGHYPTISLILERQGLLTSIINGLQYDFADNVCLVMATIKRNILEHSQISKTVKMKTFSTPVVRDIVNLYNWKGPRGYDPRKNKQVNVEVDQYDKSRVSECVHDLLLVLCTSHKFGVIFRDKMLGTGKKHQNALMYTVLESLDRPWEHSYASILVTKICAACPDLVKTMWANLKPYLEPRSSLKWLNALKFAKVLLEEMQPAVVEFCWKEYNPQQFAQMIQFLVSPTPILKTIIPENGEFESSEIKHQVLSLILDILKSIDRYIECAKVSFTPDYNRNLQRIIQNHIATNLPNSLIILKSWNEVPEKFPEYIEPFTALDNIDLALNILQFYSKLCQQHLDILLSKLSISDLVAEINAIETNAELHIKVIKLFLGFEPALFSPNNEIFQFVTPLMLQNYYENKNVLALDTLNAIFKNTGIFEGCELEINIWINSIFDFKHYHVSIADFLIKILQKSADNMVHYLNKIASLKVEDHSVHDNIAEMLENLCTERDFSESRNTITQIYFSPLILAALDEDVKDKYIKQYLSCVILGVFHQQTNPKVLTLIIKNSNTIQSSVLKYITNWQQKPLEVLGKGKGKIDAIPKLIRAIMDSNVNLITENCNLDLYSDLKLNLLQITVFYLTNLNTNLNQEISDTILELVEFLMGDNFQTILTNPILLQNFNPIKQSFQVQFITKFVQLLHKTEYDISDFLKPYHKKLFNSIMKLLQKKKAKSIDHLYEIIEIFGLGYQECYEILNQYTVLKSQDLYTDSNLSIYYNICCFCLKSFSEICSINYKKRPLDGEVVTHLCHLLSQLNKLNLNTSYFAQNLSLYLNRFPHNYENVTQTLFVSIVDKTDPCKDNFNLAISIFKHCSDLLPSFEKHLSTICTKKGLFLPLIDEVIKRDPGIDILEKSFKGFEMSINKALQKPQKAGPHFEKCYEGVSHLVGKFMNAKNYLEKINKFEVTEPFLVHMLKAMYESYLEKGSVEEKYVANAILTMVHLIFNMFKRKTKNDEEWVKLEMISGDFHAFLLKVNTDFKYEHVKSNETFKLFCKFGLKFGLSNKPYLLRLLTDFTKFINFDDKEAEELMEMVVSHSEFINVVLNNDTECKREVLELVLAVASKWKNVMKRDHVPLLLGSYGATMGDSDRIILQLLKLYESQPIQTNFYDFKPFLWGTAARNHYSLQSDLQKALWRQPKSGNVLDILQESWVLNTIKNYPLNSDFSTTAITTQHKGPVYDLGFLLPLFSQLLAPENTIPTYKFSRSGALSLTIVSLSSNKENIRKAGCHVLARFYYHLESKKMGKDNLLWLRFVEAICRGTAVLENFKLNNFVAIFLARMALILTKPQDIMYIPLSLYLGARSTPDLSSIPELYTLLHSSDVNYKEHRMFIFEILRDGLRTEADFSVSLKSMAYKILMEIYTSTTSDYESKILILEVLNSACKLQNGCRMLGNYNGLLSWLNSIIWNTKEAGVVSKIISILHNVIKLKQIDFSMVKILLGTILDKFLNMKFKQETIEMLLMCLVDLQENDKTFISETRLRTVLRFVNSDYCEYLLDFNFKQDLNDKEKNVNYYIRLLTNTFLKT